MNSLNVFFACAICVVGVLFFIQQLGGNKYDLFNPALIITLQITIGFGVNTIYWYIFSIPTKIYDLSSPSNQETVAKALAITFLGLVSFCISFSLPNLSNKRSEKSKPDSLDPFKISIILYLLTPIIIYCSIQILGEVLSQGFAVFLLRNRYGNVENALMSFMGSSLQLYIFVSLYIGSRAKEIGGATKLLLVGLLLISLLVSISGGFRGNIIIFALHFIAIRHYRYKKFSKSGALIGAVIAVILLGVMANIREKIEKGAVGRISNQDGTLYFEKILDEVFSRIQGAEMVSLVIKIIEQGEPYKYFQGAIYESSTILIPRSLWPAKPEPQSIVFGATFMTDYLLARDGWVGVNTGGFSYNIIGYLFWQAGYLGVIFGMTTLGVILKYGYQSAQLQNFRGPLGVLYITIYARTWVLTEAPQEAVNQITITLFFVGPIIVLSREQKLQKKSSVYCGDKSFLNKIDVQSKT